MLATLNLQLVPAALPDEAPGSISAGDEGQPAFTDMLRMRIDSAEHESGDLLPDAGNELPLTLPIPLATDSSISPDLEGALDTTGLDGEPADIELEVTVDQPQGAGVTANLHQTSVSATANVVIAESLIGRNSSAMAGEIPPGVISQSVETDTPLVPSLLTAKEKGQPSPTIFAAVGAAVSDDTSDQPELPRLPGTAALQAVPGGTDSTSVVERPLVHQVQPGQGAQLLTQIGVMTTTQHASTESAVAVSAESLSDIISTPVRDSNWGERIGERVLMMAGKQLQSAEIRLTPADLGPVRVHVSVDEGSANVSFHAQHAMTREALEQALPRLRELLAESGLSLGQASVNDSGVSAGNQDQSSAGEGDAHANGSSTHAHANDDPQLRQKVVTANGLIDTFA